MDDRSKAQSQRDRFEQAARELGVDPDETKLKAALRKIAPEKVSNAARQKPGDE